MNQLSVYQIIAGENIDTFNINWWVILTDQMQSGKTGTYYYVAA